MSPAVVVLHATCSKTFTTEVPDGIDNPLATETCSFHEALWHARGRDHYFFPVDAGRFGSFASGNFTVFPVQAAW